MNIKILASALCTAFFVAAPSFASTLVFGFEFSNGTDTVTGSIYGLEDDATDQKASSVIVNFQGITVDLLGPGADVREHRFAVSSGTFTNGTRFISTDPSAGRLALDFNVTRAIVSTRSSSDTVRDFIRGLDVIFTNITPSQGIVLPNTDSTPLATTLAPVPLPAGALLLLSGLLGFGVLRKKYTETASA